MAEEPEIYKYRYVGIIGSSISSLVLSALVFYHRCVQVMRYVILVCTIFEVVELEERIEEISEDWIVG
jgi:hypothetical protein